MTWKRDEESTWGCHQSKQNKHSTFMLLYCFLFFLAFGVDMSSIHPSCKMKICAIQDLQTIKTHHWPQWFQGNSWHPLSGKELWQAATSITIYGYKTKNDEWPNMIAMQQCHACKCVCLHIDFTILRQCKWKHTPCIAGWYWNHPSSINLPRRLHRDWIWHWWTKVIQGVWCQCPQKWGHWATHGTPEVWQSPEKNDVKCCWKPTK